MFPLPPRPPRDEPPNEGRPPPNEGREPPPKLGRDPNDGRAEPVRGAPPNEGRDGAAEGLKLGRLASERPTRKALAESPFCGRAALCGALFLNPLRANLGLPVLFGRLELLDLSEYMFFIYGEKTRV